MVQSGIITLYNMSLAFRMRILLCSRARVFSIRKIQSGTPEKSLEISKNAETGGEIQINIQKEQTDPLGKWITKVDFKLYFQTFDWSILWG